MKQFLGYIKLQAMICAVHSLQSIIVHDRLFQPQARCCASCIMSQFTDRPWYKTSMFSRTHVHGSDQTSSNCQSGTSMIIRQRFHSYMYMAAGYLGLGCIVTVHGICYTDCWFFAPALAYGTETNVPHVFQPSGLERQIPLLPPLNASSDLVRNYYLLSVPRVPTYRS